jgi:hypothetical protein
MPTDLTEVRLALYRSFAETGQAPVGLEQAALEELAAQRVLVLDPQTRNIRMAMPFSAQPTAFIVRHGPRSWYANCAWDALGMPAALGLSCEIEAPGYGADCVVHFAVPARDWWKDIFHT